MNVTRLFRGMRQTAALLAGLMILTVPVWADTIGISDGKLIVGTEPGDGNQLFAPTIVGSDLVLANLNAAIVTPGCSGVGTITCPLAGFQELVILGGDGDDVINLSGISGLTFDITALGGAGDDVLIGTPGNVKLFGGSGDDVLTVMTGNCFSRGTGNDVVLGSGCNAGPEPAFAPLPRQTVATPEPRGLWLLGSGLAVFIVTTRSSFERCRRWRTLWGAKLRKITC
jgi:Ca2+-binding RTX toxin-like protein